MSHASALIEKILLYEESTSPVPKESCEDLVSQALHIYMTIPSLGEKKEFEEFVQFLSEQRGGFGGTTEEMIHHMSSYQLQLLVQKFQPNMF